MSQRNYFSKVDTVFDRVNPSYLLSNLKKIKATLFYNITYNFKLREVGVDNSHTRSFIM